MTTRKKTTLYVDEELWRRLKARAYLKGMSMTTLLEELINRELEEEIDADLRRRCKVLREKYGAKDDWELFKKLLDKEFEN